MPEISSETIKLLVVALGGVRAAARALHLNEPAVLQRSRRERWMDEPAIAEACRNGRCATGQGSRSPAIMAPVSPAQALANELNELGGKSRVKFARGIAKAAEHVGTLTGKDVVENSLGIKSVIQSGSILHGWQASESPAVRVDLRITADRSVEPPPFIEAEWREQ